MEYEQNMNGFHGMFSWNVFMEFLNGISEWNSYGEFHRAMDNDPKQLAGSDMGNHSDMMGKHVGYINGQYEI